MNCSAVLISVPDELRYNIKEESLKTITWINAPTQFEKNINWLDINWQLNKQTDLSTQQPIICQFSRHVRKMLKF